MSKDLELLQKMELSDENRAKLAALLDEAKKLLAPVGFWADFHYHGPGA